MAAKLRDDPTRNVASEQTLSAGQTPRQANGRSPVSASDGVVAGPAGSGGPLGSRRCKESAERNLGYCATNLRPIFRLFAFLGRFNFLIFCSSQNRGFFLHFLCRSIVPRRICTSPIKRMTQIEAEPLRSRQSHPKTPKSAIFYIFPKGPGLLGPPEPHLY